MKPVGKSVAAATYRTQVLVNAVTGEVKSLQNHLSGNATYQALETLVEMPRRIKNIFRPQSMVCERF
jgi:hypothetical protein